MVRSYELEIEVGYQGSWQVHSGIKALSEACFLFENLRFWYDGGDDRSRVEGTEGAKNALTGY